MIKTEISTNLLNILNLNSILNQNILGILENEPNSSIYVDTIENPKGILVLNKRMNYIYTESNEFINTLKNTYLKNNTFFFSGVEKSIANKIKENFKLNWENPCNLYYMPKENINIDLIKYNVSNININDAYTIDYYYEHKNSITLDLIKTAIINRPSSAVYINGSIASWALIHNDNSMGFMFTREEYRNKDYATSVTLDLSSKIINNNKIPFVQISKHNEKSINLALKCGFKKYAEVDWFGITCK